jgi:phage terminase large subunit-like protein
MKEKDEEAIREFLIIREEYIKRRKNDPLLTFTPHSKQWPFIESVLHNKELENWFIAANRSGKSDAGTYCGAYIARFVPGSSGWVVSLDFPASRDIVQPKYFDNGFLSASASHPPFIPKNEIAPNGWRASDQILILKNGSIIGFKSCDSGRKKFQGVGKEWVHFDEEPPEEIYEECVIRVKAKKKLRIFGTCTLLPPEGQLGGVSWLFSDIIQPYKDGKLKNVGLFGASIYDNPHIDLGEIKRLEAKYPLWTVIGKIRLLGEYLPGLSGARAYTSFDRVLHVKPQPALQPRLPICWAWDFNVEPMVSLVGQIDGDVFRVHRELVLDEGNILQMVDMFREYYPYHDSEIWLYGDSTGKSRTSQTGQTDYQIILNAMRTYGAPVKMKVPEKNPPVPDRINSMNIALKDEYGRINVEVDPDCHELIADLEQVLRDSRGAIKKTHNRKDAYYKRTHTSDAFGYWISFERPVRPAANYQLGKIISRIRTPGYGFK